MSSSNNDTIFNESLSFTTLFDGCIQCCCGKQYKTYRGLQSHFRLAGISCKQKYVDESFSHTYNKRPKINNVSNASNFSNSSLPTNHNVSNDTNNNHNKKPMLLNSIEDIANTISMQEVMKIQDDIDNGNLDENSINIDDNLPLLDDVESDVTGSEVNHHDSQFLQLLPHLNHLSSDTLLNNVNTPHNVRYSPLLPINDALQEANVRPSDVKMLHSLKAQPLYLFKKMKQIQSEAINKEYNVSAHGQILLDEYSINVDIKNDSTCRDIIIKRIADMYGLNKVKPIVTKLILPFTGIKVEIVTLPYGQTLMSLLTNPILMQSNNLLFPKDSPIGRPDGIYSDYFDDVDSGSVFAKAYKKYCENPNVPNAVLLMHIVFADKTYFDVKGKCTMEPIMYTLAIFICAIRNLPIAWRPLGYMPNFNQIAPHATADQKLGNYHYILKFIFTRFVQYQKLNGIDWNLLY